MLRICEQSRVQVVPWVGRVVPDPPRDLRVPCRAVVVRVLNVALARSPLVQWLSGRRVLWQASIARERGHAARRCDHRSTRVVGQLAQRRLRLKLERPALFLLLEKPVWQRRQTLPVPEARPIRRMVQHALRVPVVVGLPHHLVVLQLSRHRDVRVAPVADLGREAMALFKSLFHRLWPFTLMLLNQILEADRVLRGSLPVRAFGRRRHLLPGLEAARGL